MAESQRVRRTESISWSRFRELWDSQRRERAHPVRSVTTTVAVVCWLGAALLVFLTWNGAAERILVAEQVPYLVSGGLGALVLTIIGSTVFLYGALVDPEGEDPSGGSGRRPSPPVGESDHR
jgi:hypothetical protein